MIVNNGIINNGNNNVNIIGLDIDYDRITKELEVLAKNSDEDLNEAIAASKEKNQNKLIKCLKKLSKGSLTLVKGLGLAALERLIEYFILG